MPRVAKPRLLWRPLYEHCARCLEKYCRHETRSLCFFIIMHQILDKCCNIQSVAKVYELKSQPSYVAICLIYHKTICNLSGCPVTLCDLIKIRLPALGIYMFECFPIDSKSTETIEPRGVAKFDSRGMTGTIYVENN